MTEDEFLEHMDNYDGYCTRCRSFTRDGGVEPDAEGYECPDCGNKTVVGAEQALFMGLVAPGAD
jgi:hypothetical protein